MALTGVFGNVFGDGDFPTEPQVLLGVVYNNGGFTGTLDPGAGAVPIYPAETDVRVGVSYGDSGVEQFDGRYYPALEANVQMGVSYGADNVEFVGIYAASTGDPSGEWIG